MPWEPWQALPYPFPTDLDKYLAEKIVRPAKEAIYAIRKASGREGGPPKEHVPTHATETAAWAYEQLTGLTATPGGNRETGERSPFECFLEDIFNALDISASAEHYAKAYRKTLREVIG